MDIREVEKKTGLERANIRYYEKEGLLTPQREENGYRNYSAENVQTLLKIKLLRRLRIPVETIGKLAANEAVLDTVLTERLAAIQKEKADLALQETVCRQMVDDRVEFATLEAKTYLDRFDKGVPSNSQANRNMYSEAFVMTHDVLRDPPHPFKRYFARQFDLGLLNLVIFVVLHGIIRVKFPFMDMMARLESFLSLFFSVFLMWFVEPFFLARFGTTPGKKIWGITVRHESGRLLTVAEGRERTSAALWQGLGLEIPGYSAYRLWKSYRSYYKDEQPLGWDYNCEVEFTDHRPFRKYVWIGATAVCILLTFWAALFSMQPGHRAPLTVETFTENYNEMREYLWSSAGAEEEEIYVMENGQLTKVKNPNYPSAGIVINLSGGEYSPPEFSYDVQDGLIKTVTLHWHEKDYSLSTVPFEATCAAAAWIGAERGAPFTGGMLTLLRSLQSSRLQMSSPGTFVTHYAGYEISGSYSLYSYDLIDSMIFYPKDKKGEMDLTITIRKE